MASTALRNPASADWQAEAAADERDPYGAPQPRFDLRFIIAAIRRRIWWVAAIFAICVAAAVLLTMLDAPRYTARASVQINEQSDRVLGNADEAASLQNMFDTERFLQTQIDVLKSRGLATRVAQKLKLQGSERFYRAMEVDPPAPGLPAQQVRDLVLGQLQANLAVELPRGSRIVGIGFSSGDPALSAEIANTFATEFIQANLQRRYDSSAYARQFVSDQLGTAKDRLEASERAVNAYARQAGLIRTRDALASGDEKGSGSGGGSVTTASLVQLNEAANRARADRFAAEARWRAINAVPLLNAKEVLADATVQSLLSERAQVQTELKQERARHLDDHPQVVELKAKAAEVNAQLQSVATGVRASIYSDFSAASAAESALEGQVSSLKGETLAEQDRSVRYNTLAREADTNRTIYDGLLQRYKELNAAAGISTSNIAVIDSAEPPLTPTSPSLARNLALGLVLALVLAAAVVFLAVQLDDAIRVPEDVEQKLGLPLLGVVPRSVGDPSEALRDPKSSVSEAYNALRGALLHSTTGGLPEVILVTSAQASEGKTTTSQAIAVSLARLGKRVLLVDADMRRPSIHRLVGSANQRGLSSLLTSQDPLESAVIDGPEANVALLTSGPIPPSPTELTSSLRFRALIDEMAAKFDAVVLDSPPILGLADAPAMSALADGVVLVIESERTRRGALRAAMRRLRTMRPVLLGAVLTKFDATKRANLYSEYYGHGYYEYRSEQAPA